MNPTRNALMFPRRVLLLVLFLIGPLVLISAVLDWLDYGKSDVTIWVRMGTGVIFTALFSLVKFTKFMVPGEELETAVRAKAVAAGKFIMKEADAAARKMEHAAEVRSKERLLRQSIEDRSAISPIPVTVLGGSGWEWAAGQTLILSMDSEFIYLTNLKDSSTTPLKLSEVTDIEIGGPGTQKSTAGVMGGGFGIHGAVTGIAIASAINLLTTRSSVNTLIRFSTSAAEIFVHTSALDLTAARLTFSSLFVKINSHQNSARSIE